MRHDWVFDVLRDLLAYAQRNDLPALAARVKEAIDVAEVEIAAARDRPQAAVDTGSLTRSPRSH